MNELTLLKLLLDSAAYKKWFSTVDMPHVKENLREVWYLYQSLQELHDQFPDRSLSLDELNSYFWAKYPDANKDSYGALFSQLSELNVSPEIGSVILSTIAERKRMLLLSETAYAVSQGTKDKSELLELLRQVEAPPEVDDVSDDLFITTDLEALINKTVLQPGIRWPLQCMNVSIGSLRKGDFGFIFARPETGKTTFLAHFVSHAFDQVEAPIIWFNNEEQDDKVMIRVIQSYFGVPLDVLMSDLKKWNRLFNEKVGHKFLLVDASKAAAGISKATVEKYVHGRKPSLIIADQLDKVKGFKADRDDLVYGEIYQWARELAKVYCPFIGVSQAGGMGEGQKWLTMDHVSNAKTSKQAEADFILGVGKTHDEAGENIRYLNISKNKLFGDTDSMPALRHGRFEVVIEPQIARYKDVIQYK